MANESITVYYEPLASVDGVQFNHETLVYTNSSGQQFVATAGPSGSAPAGNTNLYNFVESVAAQGAGLPSVYGELTGSVTSASNMTQQQLQALMGSSSNPFPSTTVATGSDLSSQWATISQKYNDLAGENLTYSPLTQNSNSAANSAMTLAGLTPPDNSMLSGLWTPAAGTDLTFSCVQNGSGNTVLTLTDDKSSDSMQLVATPSGSSTSAILSSPSSVVADAEAATANTDGSQTDNLTGYNTDGTTKFTQDTSINTSGQASVAISGIGDTDYIGNASVALAASAQATLDGVGDAVSLAANAALTLGAGATGNTVTATGTGTSVNMSGAGGTVGSGAITETGGMQVLASYEPASTSLLLGVDTDGNVVSVTGTNGTEILNSGTSGGTIQNTINFNGGSSQLQDYSVSGSTSTQNNYGYTGANGTGTELFQQTLTDTSGTISDYVTGAGYYMPVTGTTWTGIANNVIGGMLNGGQLQALDITLGEGGGIAIGTPVYLPTGEVGVGTSNSPVSMSPSTLGLTGDSYAYIEQTNDLYAVGANPSGANLSTVYALTTNGTSFADTQAGTSVSYNGGSTVTLTSTPTSGVTDTMYLGNNGNADSFTVGSIGVGFAVGSMSSLTDNDNLFTFANSSGSVGGVQLNPTSGAIDETLTGVTFSFAANATATAAGHGDSMALASGDTLTLDDTSDSINLNGMGTLSVGSTGAVTLDAGSAVASFAAGLITDVVDGTTPWFNLASGGSDQLQINPVSGITSVFANFTGTDGTGTLNQYTMDFGGSSPSSAQSIETGLASGETQQLNYYTGINDTGTLTNTTINMSAGNSTVEVFNPNGTTASDTESWSALNGGGTNTSNMLEMDNGTSQDQQLTGLPSGVTQENLDYSGADASGTQTSIIYDFTTGNSQQQITTGLPSGETEIVNNWNGPNQTGAETTSVTDYTAGNSQLEEYNVTSAIATVFAQFSGLNATGTDEQNTLNFTNGSSQSENMTGLASGTIETIAGYSGSNLSGTENYFLNDYSNNDSTLELFNPSSGINNIYQFFGDLNGVGTPNSALIYNANNTSVDIAYNYDGNSILQDDTFYQGSTELGYGVYSTSGLFVTGSYNGEANGNFGSDSGVIDDGEGDDGGYEGGYELTTSAATKGGNIGAIAQFDTNQGNAPAAAAAEAARSEISFVAQLASTSPSLINSPFYEGAKWNSEVITWSLADIAGASGSPFSGYMGPQYKALVAAAFAEWGAASGITFEQVADSSQSDIRIGWGDFNTTSSGVVGYTSSQYQNGEIQPNVIIRLEDPSESALVAGIGNSLTYSGTQANLYQVILHEIGHALGLADNADPNSVMYYQASNNVTLDSTDTAGIQALYGSGSTLSFASPASQAAINSTIQQMIQATAAFQSQQSAGGAFVPPEISVIPPSLAASQHA
jgi:hypothetical protein